MISNIKKKKKTWSKAQLIKIIERYVLLEQKHKIYLKYKSVLVDK